MDLSRRNEVATASRLKESAWAYFFCPGAAAGAGRRYGPWQSPQVLLTSGMATLSSSSVYHSDQGRGGRLALAERVVPNSIAFAAIAASARPLTSWAALKFHARPWTN